MTGPSDCTPWWEFDPEERPVPMTPGPADEAELIVNAEREAILREDTEPSVVTLAQLRAGTEPRPPQTGVPMSRRAAKLAAAGLAAACAAMFALGWAQARANVVNEAVSPATQERQAAVSLNGSDPYPTAIRKGGEA